MYKIEVLVPDMPSADELLPWLRRIDAARWYTNFGPLVHEFEATLAQHWPVAPACGGVGWEPLQLVTLNTGTAPLELGIGALDLAPGGDVLLPAFTFSATAGSVLRNGLRPVFGDVAPGSWQLTPQLARQVASERRLALVMPVATFGCPLDVAGWDAFVEDTGIPVLIDAAAAFGNQAIGRRVAVAFSFHATKPFGIGEGGALLTRDAALAARVRRASNFGFEGGVVRQVGANAKMSEYAAAVGLAQWQRWPTQRARRQALWRDYAPALASLPGLQLQQGFGAGELPATLTVSVSGALEPVLAGLAAAGIQTRRWYCPPLHQHPAFAQYPRCGPAGDDVLTATQTLARHSVGLPWFASMTAAHCEQVVDALRGVLAEAQAGQAGLCLEQLS